MEEDVRYSEELMRWLQRMNAALRTLSPADEQNLREWQGESGNAAWRIVKWWGTNRARC